MKIGLIIFCFSFLSLYLIVPSEGKIIALECKKVFKGEAEEVKEAFDNLQKEKVHESLPKVLVEAKIYQKEQNGEHLSDVETWVKDYGYQNVSERYREECFREAMQKIPTSDPQIEKLENGTTIIKNPKINAEVFNEAINNCWRQAMDPLHRLAAQEMMKAKKKQIEEGKWATWLVYYKPTDTSSTSENNKIYALPLGNEK